MVVKQQADWEMELGNLTNGGSAGSIRINADLESGFDVSPALLGYSSPSAEIEVIEDGAGSVRQILSPESFVDVVTIDSASFEVRVYLPSAIGTLAGGVYEVNGTPMVTYRFEEAVAGGASGLSLTEIRGGVVETETITWDSVTRTVSVIEGNDSRRETWIETVDAAEGTRTVRSEVRDNGGVLLSVSEAVYKTFSWGESLIEQINDPDGVAETTTYSYYETAQEAGPQVVGRLKVVVHPDGGWEYREYVGGNARLHRVYRPWKDGPAVPETTPDASECRVTEYWYGLWPGEQEIPTFITSVQQRIAGTTVASDDYSIVADVEGGEPVFVRSHSSGWLFGVEIDFPDVTTTYTQSASPHLRGRVRSHQTRDGRLTTHDYEEGDYDEVAKAFTPNPGGFAFRETVTHGTTTDPDGIAGETTRETQIYRMGELMLSETYVCTAPGAFDRLSWTAYEYDTEGRRTRTLENDRVVSEQVWQDGRLISSSDAVGRTTSYTYDGAGRVATETREASAQIPALVTSYTYDGEGRVITEALSGGGLTVSRSQSYDLLGRMTSATDYDGLTTTYAYGPGSSWRSVTGPDGETVTTTRYLDGETKSVVGGPVVDQFFAHEVSAEGLETEVRLGVVDSPRWTRTFHDGEGRVLKEVRPAFGGATIDILYAYDRHGRPEARSLPGTAGMWQRWEYDELGEVVRSGVDVDGDEVLTPASDDQIQEAASFYSQANGEWRLVQEQRTYPTSGLDQALLVSRTERQLTGLGPTTLSLDAMEDAFGAVTTTTTVVDRAAKTSTAASVSTRDGTSVSVSENGYLVSETLPGVGENRAYTYDALGRSLSVDDPASGLTTTSYVANSNQVAYTENQLGERTAFDYYAPGEVSAGRIKTVTNALQKTTHYEYDAAGRLLRQWGQAVYPQEYTYDVYGARASLKTFRAEAGWEAAQWPGGAGGDTTQWRYDAATGLLIEKEDAAGEKVVYTYNTSNQLQTRTWARGVVTTYAYDDQARLQSVAYSDGTPAVNYGHDRQGLITTLEDAAGQRTMTYSPEGFPTGEAWTAGLLAGAELRREPDASGRYGAVEAFENAGATSLLRADYSYDAQSRLSSVGAGDITIAQTYEPNTGRRSTRRYDTLAGGVGIVEASQTYDAVGRIAETRAEANGSVTDRRIHQLDALGRRTRIDLHDGSYWSHTYNDRNEVTGGGKFFPDGTPYGGMQFGYNYDAIGNRLTSAAGGNTSGTGLEQTTYAANALNQYSTITHPTTRSIVGTANAAATVRVNGLTAPRQDGGYFVRSAPLGNQGGPNAAPFKVTAQEGGQEESLREGVLLAPPRDSVLEYDEDGNLLSDGLWLYTWNGENRLIEVESAPGVPDARKVRVTYVYDSQGRRVSKTVSQWHAPAADYVLREQRRWLCDDWNPVVEWVGERVLKTYVWGIDLSGTWQSAGGVGGLWAIENRSSLGSEILFPGYDALGNVIQLLDEQGGLVAAYEYSPFGQTLRAEGVEADANPWRFSTKAEERETEYSYFGYRYYSVHLGRWLSRDPIQESGGVNLYSMVTNDPIGLFDVAGLLGRSPVVAPVVPPAPLPVAPISPPVVPPVVPIGPNPAPQSPPANDRSRTSPGVPFGTIATMFSNPTAEMARELLKVRNKSKLDRKTLRKICPCYPAKTRINYIGSAFITSKARGAAGVYSSLLPRTGTRPAAYPPGFFEARAFYGPRTIHRGHLWARRFGGTGQLRNIVSMHRTINLSNATRIENQVARMASSNVNVCFVVLARYRKYWGTPPMRSTVVLPAGFHEFPVPRTIRYIAVGSNSGEVFSRDLDLLEMKGHPYDLPPIDPFSGRGQKNTMKEVLLN